MSNDLTIDKPAFLRERGWNTWYNENYWVRQDHHLPGIDYTSCGLNTEEAYAFETDPESKKRTLAGMELYHSAATYRTKVDIEDIVPNERQPRLGPKEDEELQRQIEANEGLFEPLLVEPHPNLPNKYRIIDGDRRWTNSFVLVKRGKEQYRQVPVEVTDRTLSDDERLRVWIYIHRQRKEWDTREKEMVAYSLIELVGRASAANILGITVRELDKLSDVFELSSRFNNLREPGASITWARELAGVSKNLLSPSVIDAVVEKVNQKRITSSKDLRKLRKVLRDPVAKANFLSSEGDIDSAMLRIAPVEINTKDGLVSELGTAMEAMKRVPWTTLEQLKGNADILKQINEAETLLKNLRKTLSS